MNMNNSWVDWDEIVGTVRDNVSLDEVVQISGPPYDKDRVTKTILQRVSVMR